MKKTKKLILLALILCLLLVGFLAYNYVNTPRMVTYRYGTDIFKDSEYIDTDQPELNKSVSESARNKYTFLTGKGKDKVTVLFYVIADNNDKDTSEMIGTLNNIAYAKDSSFLNVVIQTGGSSCWNSQVLEDEKIQRWTANSDSLTPLEDTLHYTSMCDPACLKDFLLSSMTRFPADRYELFLIGQGSFDSFGYDPDGTHSSLSYQTISEVLSSLPNAIDLLGIDAPYASSLANAILFEPYVDYMVAFESQVVSSGLLYQSFLSKLAENSSTSTLQLGKLLLDSYAMNYAQKNYSVPYILSLTDLSEIKNIQENDLRAFGNEMNELIDSGTFRTISDVLSSTTNIGPSFQKNLIDITHFSKRLTTVSANTLYSDLSSCIKYRRTKESLNAYGLSSSFSYHTSSITSSMNIYPQEYISFIQKFQLYTALSQVYSTMVYPTFSQQLGRNAFNEEKDLNTDKLISSPLLKETFPAYSFFTQDDLKKAAEYILSQNINKDHLRLQRKGDTLIYPVSDDDLAMMHDIHKVFYLKKNHLYAHIGNSSKITYNALNQPIFQYDDSWYYINNQPVPFIPASSDLNKDIIGYAHANVNNAEAYLLFSKKSYEAIPSIIGYIEIHDDSAVLAKGITALTSNDTITLLYESFQLDGSYSGLSPLFKPVSFDNTTVSAHALPKDTLGSLVIQDFYHTSYFSTFLSSSLTDSQ